MWFAVLMVVAVALGLLMLIALPIILVGIILGAVLFVLIQILLLPIRMLGWGLALGFGAIGLFVRVFLMILFGILGAVLMLGLALPLLPLVLIGIGIWLLVRPARPRYQGPAIS